MRKTPGRYEVSVLPDVFLDRIVTVGSIDSFFKSAKEKVSIGGGSMRGFKEQEIIGGNAANVAKALAALGVNVNLFVVGDGFAESILRWYFSDYPNAKVFVMKGRPGYTVALEFLEGDKHANVMVSDMGDVDNFDGSAFSEKDLELIARSDAVALVNWSANLRGNELAVRVFSLPTKKECLTFLDLADPGGAVSRFPGLVDEVISKGLLRSLSLNENELRVLARFQKTNVLPEPYTLEDLTHAAQDLSKVMSISIEAHTALGTCSVAGNEVASAKTFSVQPKILTGAGDAWNAAEIFATLSGFDRQDRIVFANAYAATYVSENRERSPRLEDVEAFLSSKGITFS